MSARAMTFRDRQVTFESETAGRGEQSRYGVYVDGERVGLVAWRPVEPGSRRGRWTTSDPNAYGGTREHAVQQLLARAELAARGIPL